MPKGVFVISGMSKRIHCDKPQFKRLVKNTKPIKTTNGDAFMYEIDSDCFRHEGDSLRVYFDTNGNCTFEEVENA